MLENLHELWVWVLFFFEWFLALLVSNGLVVIGFVLAVIIILRIFREQRQPSSIFAWSFLIISIPPLGIPLYVLLGGRKLKKKIQAKGLLTEGVEDGNHSINVQDQFYSTGNRVKFLTDGQIAFHTYCRLIKEAQHEIHILTYILGDDETGNKILELLIKKAQEGIRVRLLVDALGSFRRPGKKIRELKQAGGEVCTFMPALPFQTHGWANLRNHRKIAVFDNKKSILGGRNLDKRFMGAAGDQDRFYDFGAVYEGPIVDCLNGIFLSDWAFASKQPLDQIKDLVPALDVEVGSSKLTGIVSGPDVDGDMLYERLVNVIQEFQDELVIVTPYFIPDEVLLTSLTVKARRGKRITLILPEKSNWKVVDFVRSHYLRELYDAGVNIQLFTDGMLHAKVMISDRRLLLHGSANFDIRSLFVNFEIGIIHTSQEDLESVFVWLEWLLERCRPFGTEKELHPGRSRRTIEDAARLIAPML